MGSLTGGKTLARWDESQRTLEHALSRPDGLFRGLLDPRSWLDVVKVCFYGMSGVLWERLMGGDSPQPTTMVLASLMYNNTGKLGNPAQVVDI